MICLNEIDLVIDQNAKQVKVSVILLGKRVTDDDAMIPKFDLPMSDTTGKPKGQVNRILRGALCAQQLTKNLIADGGQGMCIRAIKAWHILFTTGWRKEYLSQAAVTGNDDGCARDIKTLLASERHLRVKVF